MTTGETSRTRLVRDQLDLPPESLGDPLRGLRRNLMLPDPDHSPFRSAQLSIADAITLHVSGDLRAPIGSVGSGTRAVLRASMPEAAIDEDRHLLAPKDDVRSATQALQWLRVDAIAKAAPMKLRPKGKLRSGVPLAVALHRGPDGARRGRGCFGNDSEFGSGAHSIGGSF